MLIVLATVVLLLILAGKLFKVILINKVMFYAMGEKPLILFDLTILIISYPTAQS